MELFLYIGGGLAVLFLVVGIIVSATGERAMVDDRINKYLDEGHKRESDKESKTALTDWVNKRVVTTSFGDRIARDLARAAEPAPAGLFQQRLHGRGRSNALQRPAESARRAGEH